MRLPAPFTILCLLLLISALGCADKRQPRGSLPSPLGDEVKSSGPRGTVDGSGGAGINGKPIELYRVKIETWSEYQSHIVPILNSLKKIHPEYGEIFRYGAEKKAWYLLPSDLPALSGAEMGLPVNADQWALQNETAVWLAQPKYQGDPLNKATILLHEMFVAIKLLRYASFEEVCSIGSSSPCNSRITEPLKRNVKLSPKDYDEVRSAVVWLMANHGRMTPEQFHNEMYRLNMEGRFIRFGKYLSHPKTTGDTIERVDRLRVLEELSGQIVKMYTEYNQNGIASEKCNASFRFNSATNELSLRATARRKNRPPLIFEGTFTVDVKGDFYQNHNPRYEYSGFSVHLSNRPQVPEKQISLSFRSGRLISLSVSLMKKVEENQNGALSMSAANGFVYCQNSQALIPQDWPLWLLYPEEDRIQMERAEYGGQSLDELKKGGKVHVELF